MHSKISFLILSALLYLPLLSAQETCPVPLYTDPVFKGSADPEIVWNEAENEWWFFYTSRRSVCEGAPLPASAIGIARSKDWISWEHKGYITIDGIGGEPLGPDVLWAPGIIRDGDTYHMFLTFKKGKGKGKIRWGIPESLLLHLTADVSDLMTWETQGIVHVPYTSIDATMVNHKGSWHLYHRDITPGQKGVNTYHVSTKDLYAKHAKWTYHGPAKGDINDIHIHGYNYQEAQYTFFWKGYYWMLTDPSAPGIPVYRSENLDTWKYMGTIMEEEGKSEFQKGQVRHPGIAVVGDRAFMFYFNQPFRAIEGHSAPETCFIQVSEIFYKDGTLLCNRNALVIPPENLIPENGQWGFIGKQ